jgi:hypothetical protein
MSEPAPRLSSDEIDRGERYADRHDPGDLEQYAGEPVADPWEEGDADGQLDPGAVPGGPAQ